MPTMILAKFLHGVFVTICHISACKMISETIPKTKQSLFTPVMAVFGALGYCLVFGLGMLLPLEDFKPGLPLVDDNLKAK